METTIGRAFGQRRKSAWLAVAVAIAAISADMLLAGLQPGRDGPRIALAGAALCVMALLGRGKRLSLGLTLRMAPSYRYWAAAALLIGAVVGAFCLVAVPVLRAVGIDIPIPMLPPDLVMFVLGHTCCKAPLLEEALYRLVLCAPLAAVAGPRLAICASGAVFAGLHFVYGNPGPDNFIAGYLLAWAYLRSGCVLTPVLLHALGNACVIGMQVIHWHIAGQ